VRPIQLAQRVVLDWRHKRESEMATLFRLTGIPEGLVDKEKREITFRMQVEDGRLLEFVAPVVVAEQMASALGGLAKQVGPAKGQMINAQVVAQYGIQRDAFGGPVILQLERVPNSQNR
jgi:hypothetical protein